MIGSARWYALVHFSSLAFTERLQQLGDLDASAIVSTTDLDKCSPAVDTAAATATAAAQAAQPSVRPQEKGAGIAIVAVMAWGVCFVGSLCFRWAFSHSDAQWGKFSTY